MVSLIISFVGLIAGLISLTIMLTWVRRLNKELEYAENAFAKCGFIMELMINDLEKYKGKRDDKGRFIKKDKPQT